RSRPRRRRRARPAAKQRRGHRHAPPLRAGSRVAPPPPPTPPESRRPSGRWSPLRRERRSRQNRRMAIEQHTESERVIAARERYVPRGISTPPIVVARAEGARVE